MSDMFDTVEFGEWIEMLDGWYVVVSILDPWQPGCHGWRDGSTRTQPELVNPDWERKVRNAPPPRPPGDPASRYLAIGWPL